MLPVSSRWIGIAIIYFRVCVRTHFQLYYFKSTAANKYILHTRALNKPRTNYFNICLKCPVWQRTWLIWIHLGWAGSPLLPHPFFPYRDQFLLSLHWGYFPYCFIINFLYIYGNSSFNFIVFTSPRFAVISHISDFNSEWGKRTFYFRTKLDSNPD